MTFVMLFMMLVFFSNLALRPYTFVLTCAMLAMMGWINGYVTGRLLKFFGSDDWLGSACLASIVFPTWFIGTLSIVDVIEWDTESSAKVPYSAALGMIFAWLLLTVPLSMHGAYRAFTDRAAQKPKVNLVRRLIPS